ncbi:MAG TPA: hypothetical protein VK487_11590 [Candidatus Bathyarchaeia archaeon]|nr:hypothetical protein [Candidatus Bathyarchaeia archaeon]
MASAVAVRDRFLSGLSRATLVKLKLKALGSGLGSGFWELLSML